jgi:hypothetical protein
MDDAAHLAEIGKTADAVVKLGDLHVKVDALLAAGRISAESAGLLTMEIAAVTECLGTP